MSCSRSLGMSNSDRSRWKLTEQTMIRVRYTLYNIHSAATWCQWHNDKKVWLGQRLATEYTWPSRSRRWHSSSRPPHRRTILKDWENKCIVAKKEHRGMYPQRRASPTSKYQFFESHERQYRAHVLRMWAFKHHTKNVEGGRKWKPQTRPSHHGEGSQSWIYEPLKP